MTVRAWIIDRPVEVESPAGAVDAGIAKPCTGPFGFLVPVGRKRKSLVFGGWVLFEGPLRAQNPPEAQCGGGDATCRTASHSSASCAHITSACPRLPAD